MAYLALGSHIVNLDLSIRSGDGNVSAISRPAYRGDVVARRGRVAELKGLAVSSVPEVDGRVKGNSNHVVGTPVQEVEVEVRSHLWGVQDAVGGRGNHSSRLLGGGHSAVLGVKHAEVVLVTLLGLRGLRLERQDLGVVLARVGLDAIGIVSLGGAGSLLVGSQAEASRLHVHHGPVGNESVAL
jgi:hypothetical protein